MFHQSNITIILIIILTALSFLNCSDTTSPNPEPEKSSLEVETSQVDVTIAKWYNNHAGAISICYDGGAPHHAIGDTANWGYYQLDSFESDLMAIQERDLWNASMNEITLYDRARPYVSLC